MDAECGGGKVAYVYPIGAPVVEPAVQSGCYAPIGAWTNETDPASGGVRKVVYELRANEKQTLVCCW